MSTTETPSPASMPAQRALPPKQPRIEYPAPGTLPEYHTRGVHKDVHTSTLDGAPAGETYTRMTITDWITWHVEKGWKLQAADEESAVVTRHNMSRVVHPCPHAKP
jgi:hypothetical protein